MNISIEVIPHGEQRYPTCGDWFYAANGSLYITVSKMGNWKYEMAVAIHELVEVLLCKVAGISQESVDAFDIAFEKKRKKGNVDEPGDDPKAPYHRQHCVATGIERIFIASCGESWKKYEEAVLAL